MSFTLLKRLYSDTLQSSQDSLFLKWFNKNTIAYIISNMIYHWHIYNDNETNPIQRFNPKIGNKDFEYTEYDSSINGHCSIIQGIVRKSNDKTKFNKAITIL